MNNCLVNGSRFLGLVGDVNVRGMSGTTYSDIYSLSLEKRIEEGIYYYIIDEVYPTYEELIDGESVLLNYPHSLCSLNEETISIDKDNATYKITRLYTLVEKNIILEILLEQLKDARKDATLNGFVYKGERCVADRDAQTDIRNIYQLYIDGLISDDTIYRYKVKNGVYIDLDSEHNKLVKSGKQGVKDFMIAMFKFVQEECFHKEHLLAKKWASLSSYELAKISVFEEYKPDDYS